MRRALIIDDSPATRRYLARLLEELGWEVRTEESAEHGAASALTNPPDLILSDLRMPGLSGLQLCRLLRDDPVTAHIPVVLLTATLDKRTRFWGLQCGASAVLDKQYAAELPGLLDSIAGLATATSPRAAAMPVSAASIPTRLSHLLDRSLYESVVASELRSLALADGSHEFFDRLVHLLGRITDYQWLALGAFRGDATSGCVHVHSDRREPSISEALDALGLVPGSTVEPLHLLADKRCVRSGANFTVEVHPISIAGVALGNLAIKIDSEQHTDKNFFSFVANELAPALRSVSLSDEARQLALTDALTGLHNRRSANDALARCRSEATRYRTPLSVAMVDVDHFKRVNDTHGHHVGDRALQHVARLIQRAARKSDITARWGGEEFLIIMPSTGTTGARVAVERTRILIAENPLVLEDGTKLEITASLGLASLNPDEREVEFVNRADQALYLAKQRGRNRVEAG